MTPERQAAVLAVVSAARELLHDESRFLELAREIGRLAPQIDPELHDSELTTFVAIDSESDGIAIGEALDVWAPALRSAKETEAQRFVIQYREASLRDAAILIDRYGAA